MRSLVAMPTAAAITIAPSRTGRCAPMPMMAPAARAARGARGARGAGGDLQRSDPDEDLPSGFDRCVLAPGGRGCCEEVRIGDANDGVGRGSEREAGNDEDGCENGSDDECK